jgi:uncharacterized hydrophobic protein (TIGR00271 family)
MLHLRIYGPAGTMVEVGRGLEEGGAVRHLALAPGIRPGFALLTAAVSAEAADEVLAFLLRHGDPHDDIALARLDEIGPVEPGGFGTALIWADVVGQARRNARAVSRYLVFMAVAGVIAAFGVIDDNPTLIVGAMAVSPDTLPIAAACVGIVSRRGRLARRALVTLAAGLAVTCVCATVLTIFLDLLDLLPSGFAVGASSLSGLAKVNSATIGVALAAGVAGMLAFETRASSAVGVAISVTTIPASAYLGVAAGVGESDRAWGALAVLGVNVALLLVSGTATLLVQRRFAEHARTVRA